MRQVEWVNGMTWDGMDKDGVDGMDGMMGWDRICYETRMGWDPSGANLR